MEATASGRGAPWALTLALESQSPSLSSLLEPSEGGFFLRYSASEPPQVPGGDVVIMAPSLRPVFCCVNKVEDDGWPALRSRSFCHADSIPNVRSLATS